jgi:hypothetical protein
MYRIFTLLLLFSLAPAAVPTLCAQDEAPTPQSLVLAEGRALYRLEKAAWVGTDLMRAEFPDEMGKVGGYATYPDGPNTHCVFFAKDSATTILADFSFDSTFASNTATVDRIRQYPTEKELRLRTLRSRAIAHMSTDTIFKTYKNSNLNIVPMVHRGVAKVYILTGPSVAGVVIFGNDYLIEFDGQDEVKSARTLHRNIIPIEYGEEEVETYHSHAESTGSFMTPTDICTLMLYGPYTNWTKHTVLSKTHWNLWSVEKNTMAVLTRKAMDKIRKSMKKMDKKRAKKKKNKSR